MASRSFRAPRDHRATLVDPAPDRWDAAIEDNRRWLPTLWRALDLSPRAVGQTRRDLLAASVRYGAEHLNSPPAIANSDLDRDEVPRVLLTGHQSHWFHPGVWFKNALLAAHGERLGCRPLNLVIDNDVLGLAVVRSLAGTPADPFGATIPFDLPTEDTPLEERRPQDLSLVRSFASRATAEVASFQKAPAIATYGAGFAELAASTNRLGEAIARTRHRMEIDAGWRAWDLPLSQACRSPLFARFVRRILDEATWFATVHNECLIRFQEAHKIRSRSHPVPALSITSDGNAAMEVETPFWLWRAGPAARRRRAFVRRRGGGIWLTDLHDVDLPLPARADDDGWIESIEQAGIRLRPRALMTTLFARGVLSDLFVHGIGGAVYDQLLDEIVRRWLRVEPPSFVVATATFHAGDASGLPTLDDVRRAEGIVRRVEQQPDWALTRFSTRSLTADVAADIATKRRLIAERPSQGSRRDWHQALQAIDDRLTLAATEEMADAKNQARAIRDASRRAELFRWRESPLCLFPHQEMTRALLDLTACNA